MGADLEEMLIETFIPLPTIEAFDNAVLHGPAWRDIVPINIPVLLPYWHRVRGQFGLALRETEQSGQFPILELQDDPLRIAANT